MNINKGIWKPLISCEESYSLDEKAGSNWTLGMQGCVDDLSIKR